jgi:hypothetical protein
MDTARSAAQRLQLASEGVFQVLRLAKPYRLRPSQWALVVCCVVGERYGPSGRLAAFLAF